jgi:hypothetical protein
VFPGQWILARDSGEDPEVLAPDLNIGPGTVPLVGDWDGDGDDDIGVYVPNAYVDFETGYGTQDQNRLPWVEEWTYRSTASSNSGTYSLKMEDYEADSSDNASLSLRLETTTGNIQFAHRVTAEIGVLTFYIDGEEYGRWSGQESSFTEESFPVAAGTHRFRWIFQGDPDGSNVAYIDDIVFPTAKWTLVDLDTGQVATPDIGGSVDNFPLVGDWNNDGRDDIGFYKPDADRDQGEYFWYLAHLDSDFFGVVSKIDTPIIGGGPGEVPVVGDDDFGLYRPNDDSEWVLAVLHSNGLVSYRIHPNFDGGLDQAPVIGNWDGDGRDDIGLYRPNYSQKWLLADLGPDGNVLRQLVPNPGGGHVVIDADEQFAIPEGTSINFAGTATDMEDGDVSGDLAWNSSIDGAIGTGGAYSGVLSVGSHTIEALVTDNGGLPGSDSITVIIEPEGDNTAPTIESVGVSAALEDPALPGDLVIVTVNFSDIDPLDSHSVTVEWGDGDVTGPSGNASGLGFRVWHQYTAGGVYEILVTVEDNRGGIAEATTQAVVTGARVSEDRLLQVIGTSGDDSVTVKKFGEQLVVDASFLDSVGNLAPSQAALNSALSAPGKLLFDAAAVDAMRIELGDGNDLAIVSGRWRSAQRLTAGEARTCWLAAAVVTR